MPRKKEYKTVAYFEQFRFLKIMFLIRIGSIASRIGVIAIRFDTIAITINTFPITIDAIAVVL